MYEYVDVFTTGELVGAVGAVRVVVTLLLLRDALVVSAAELVRRADGCRRNTPGDLRQF